MLASEVHTHTILIGHSAVAAKFLPLHRYVLAHCWGQFSVAQCCHCSQAAVCSTVEALSGPSSTKAGICVAQAKHYQNSHWLRQVLWLHSACFRNNNCVPLSGKHFGMHRATWRSRKCGRSYCSAAVTWLKHDFSAYQALHSSRSPFSQQLSTPRRWVGRECFCIHNCWGVLRCLGVQLQEQISACHVHCTLGRRGGVQATR